MLSSAIGVDAATLRPANAWLGYITCPLEYEYPTGTSRYDSGKYGMVARADKDATGCTWDGWKDGYGAAAGTTNGAGEVVFIGFIAKPTSRRP